MAKGKFGELKKLDLRKAWSHEAHEFTPWLHDNIDALGEALGMTLQAKKTEVAIGDFSLDLLAEDDDGRTVAIENQFHWTNHSHLGQLLTYAAGCEADVLIWVTEEVRDEHRAAVEWLNQKTSTETEFYLVKVEVLQIDNSPFAYQFIPVVAANKWQKTANEQTTAKTREDAVCGRYFHRFIEELAEKKFPFDLARRHRDSTAYRLFSCNIPGHRWVYAHEIAENYASVYLWLWKAQQHVADKTYAELVARKKTIEKKWGSKLEWWDEYTIGVSRPGAFGDNEESLAEIRKWAVGQMLKLGKAIPPAMLKKIAAKLDAENRENIPAFISSSFPGSSFPGSSFPISSFPSGTYRR